MIQSLPKKLSTIFIVFLPGFYALTCHPIIVSPKSKRGATVQVPEASIRTMCQVRVLCIG